MDKIRRILFSRLQKTAGGASFGRLIHVSLMTAIFILAGCSSKPIPSATATATHKATATSTATLVPTATIAPKPDYVTDENSVEIDNGTVFVKDEKAMLYDPKTGLVTEITDLSTEVVFNTTADASKIVLAMHAAEFANLTKDEFYPGGADITQGNYLKRVDGITFPGNVDQGTYIPAAIIPVEYVQVRSPLEDPDPRYANLAMIMAKQLNNPRPFPFVVGFTDAHDTFTSFYNQISVNTPESYPGTKEVWGILETSDWGEIQQLVGKNIISATFLAEIMPETSANFSESAVVDEMTNPVDQQPNTYLDSSVEAERNRLIQLNLKQAELGYEYKHGSVEGDNVKKSGQFFAAVEQRMLDRGMTSFFFLTSRSYFQIITVTK